jgi:hypothetical protein
VRRVLVVSAVSVASGEWVGCALGEWVSGVRRMTGVAGGPVRRMSG